jgi:rhodanese-related sulfurtransferase
MTSSTINTLTVQELAVWLKDRPRSSFIDVREQSELKEQGIIKGYDANIPYFLTNTDPALFEKQFSALDREQQV